MATSRKLLVSLVAVSASLALTLTACGSSDSGSSSSSASSDSKDSKGSKDSESTNDVPAVDYLHATYDELADGGTLNLTLAELSPQQNPFHQDGTAYTTSVWRWYNPNAILFDDDANPYPNEDYLLSMTDEVVDGNTVVTYDINPKAKWNDGTPIDWTVFRDTWTINNGKDENYSPSSTDGYDKILKVEQGENDRQAVVTFDGSWPWWPGLFNIWANPHLVDYTTYAEGYLEQLRPEWGAGPYTIKEANFEQDYVILERNPNWWGKPGKLDSVNLTYRESQAALNAFKNGETDSIGFGSRENYEALKNMEGIQRQTSRDTRVVLMMQNAQSPILSDAKVREAIFDGIDREQYSAVRFDGIGYHETPPGSFVLFPNQEGYEDNFSKAVQFDQEKSKKLLEEAGWVEGADGIREKDGEKLSVRLPIFGDSQATQAQALVIQKMLKDVGVDVVIDQRPSREFSDVYSKRDFDIFLMGFSSSDPYGVAYFDQIYGSDSGLNLSGTGTEAFDEKIAELQKLPTAEEQIKRANELEVEAFKLYGIMPLANGPAMVALKDGLANMGATGFALQPRNMIGWKK